MRDGEVMVEVLKMDLAYIARVPVLFPVSVYRSWSRSKLGLTVLRDESENGLRTRLSQ